MSIRKRADREHSAHLQGTLDLLILRTLLHGAAARPGHRPRHPGAIRRCADRRAWLAVSRAATARRAALRQCRVGHFREQPQSAFLYAHEKRSRRTYTRAQRVDTRSPRRSCGCSIRNRPDSPFAVTIFVTPRFRNVIASHPRDRAIHGNTPIFSWQRDCSLRRHGFQHGSHRRRVPHCGRARRVHRMVEPRRLRAGLDGQHRITGG